MKKIFALMLIALLQPLIVGAQINSKPQIQSLVFKNVTVIDVANGETRPQMTVIVSGNRITEIGRKVKIPQKAEVIDASGKFLIPGLWDMHAHLLNPNKRDSFFALYVVNGVTAVRDMHSVMPMPEINLWRTQIADGTFLGPRVIAVAGPLISGPRSAFNPESRVGTEAEARQAVVSRKQAGVDFIKIHAQIPREIYFAIADEARKQRIPLIGHVPVTISAGEASDAGQRCIEHSSVFSLSYSSSEAELRKEAIEATDKVGIPLALTNFRMRIKARETFSEQKARALFEKFRANGTWVVPTLVQGLVWQYLENGRLPYKDWLKYMPQSFTGNWKNAPGFGQPTPQDFIEGEKDFRKNIEMVGAMHRAGVKIMAGTDANGGFPALIPGISLHEELRLFVEAGFTPLEALQTATVNPAKFLGKEKEIGTIEKGRLADLVLLEANPLENISNTRRIDAVVVDGRYLPKDALQKLLVEVEAAANREKPR